MTRERLRPVDAAIVAAVIVASRLFIFHVLGVSPNETYLVEHWQNLDLQVLSDGLFSALYHQHSQPPLWNFLIGSFSVMCEADLSCVTRSIHVLNAGFTFVVVLIIADFLIEYGLARRFAVILATLFAFLPGTVFYENYAFYPQVTLFLSSVTLFFAFRYQRSGGVAALAGALMGLVLLSWTWGIFHPFVMCIAILVVLVSNAVTLPKLLVAAAFVLLMFAPSMKNQAAFGFWGSSSWLGLNVSQVAPQQPEGCSFNGFRATVSDIEHAGTAFNDPAIIPYSADCREKAVAAIKAEPVAYVTETIKRALRSTKLASSDYFFPPNGFDAYPRWSGKHELKFDDGGWNFPGMAMALPVFFLNVTLFALLLVSPLICPPAFRSVAILSVLLFLLLFVVGHMVNGIEQERFRYSIGSVLYVIFVVTVLRIAGIPRASERPVG